MTASNVKPMEEMTWREAAALEAERLRIPLPLPSNKPRQFVAQPIGEDAINSNASRRRHVSGEMNRLEQKYAAHLEERRIVGEILYWDFETIKFRLAKATFLTPDFFVMMPDRTIEIHETKGHWEDDARVKWKIAVEKFPGIRFVAVTWHKELGWQFKTVGG